MFKPAYVLPVCLAMTLIVRGLPPLWAAQATSYTLANGLRVRLVPEPDPGNVSMFLAVRAGMLNEGQGEPHLAHVTEHVSVYDLANVRLADSVKNWSAQGKANAETLGEFMYFDLHCKSDELPTALGIEAGRLGRMNYAAATLEREIPRALSEADHLLKVPNGMTKFALVPFVQSAFHGQTEVPLRRQTKAIGLDDVRDFHDRCFRVDSAVLVVIGDFDVAQAHKEIENRFGSLANSKVPLARRPDLAPGKRSVLWDVAKRHWFIGWQIPQSSDADYPALYLAGQLLQERLFKSSDCAALGVMPLVQTDFDRLLAVGCEAPTEESFDALRKCVVSEVDRLGPPGAFDDRALRSLRGQIEQLRQTDLDSIPLPAGMTRAMGRTNIELQRMRVEMIAGDFDRFVAKLRAVTPEATSAAIARWLSPDRATIVEVVPQD